MTSSLKGKEIIDLGFFVRNDTKYNSNDELKVKANKTTIIRVIEIDKKCYVIRVMGKSRDVLYNGLLSRSSITKTMLNKYYTPLEDILNDGLVVWHNRGYKRSDAYIGSTYATSLMEGEYILEFPNNDVLLYESEKHSFHIEPQMRNPENVYHRMNTKVWDLDNKWNTEKIIEELSNRKLPEYFDPMFQDDNSFSF